MTSEIKKVRKRGMSRYRRRKFWFWSILIILLLLGIVLFLLFSRTKVEHQLIRVASCGCVNHRAVYTMREGSDMAMLIRMSNGFSVNADVARVNLERIVMHDSVYHIPCLGLGGNSKRAEFISAINQSIKTSYTDLSKQVVATSKDKEIEMFSILYVGMPAVYVIINYYPEFHRISFMHIPHSALFINTEYRLVDMFFTFGVYPTMRILENNLKQKIDFYLIQDRFNFIDLIDLLGGVEVNLDVPYADEYKLKPGKEVIDGYHAWEYIRFLDWRNLPMKVQSGRKMDLIREDNFQVDPNVLEVIYETRNQRQRHVLEGMRKSFINMSPSDQMYVVDGFKNVFRTDMSNEFLMKLYRDLLSTPNFSYGSIPGYYSTEGNKLYFYPDLPSFEMLRKKEIRTYLEKRHNKNQIIY